MRAEDLAEILEALWPDHKIPDPVVVELARRAKPWPLSLEQIRAALTSYRIECGRYEQRTPDPANLEKSLRTAAFGSKKPKPSPGSSEYNPTADGVERFGFREYCRRAKKAGLKIYPGMLEIFGKGREQLDAERKHREAARLAGYRRSQR